MHSVGDFRGFTLQRDAGAPDHMTFGILFPGNIRCKASTIDVTATTAGHLGEAVPLTPYQELSGSLQFLASTRHPFFSILFQATTSRASIPETECVAVSEAAKARRFFSQTVIRRIGV